MKTFEYTIKDEAGIHARPAGMLAKTAKEFESKIIIKKGDAEANAANIMQIMALCAKCGETIKLSVSGEDEADAAEAIEIFLKNNL